MSVLLFGGAMNDRRAVGQRNNMRPAKAAVSPDGDRKGGKPATVLRLATWELRWPGLGEWTARVRTGDLDAAGSYLRRAEYLPRRRRRDRAGWRAERRMLRRRQRTEYATRRKGEPD